MLSLVCGSFTCDNIFNPVYLTPNFMHKERINLMDDTATVLYKMSNGNPGAIGALAQILQSGNIDPDNSLGGIGPILLLDTYGIYGTDIYILWNDICKREIVKTLAVLRATQLGFFSSHILKDACSRQDRSGVALVPVDELLTKVKERLPKFALAD